MEDPSDGRHEKQKHRRNYGKTYTYLVFGYGQTDLSSIDPNNNNNNNNNNNKTNYMTYGTRRLNAAFTRAPQ